MTEEINFKLICNLTTNVMEMPEGALSLRSRKRPLQVARAVASYIGRKEENIHHTIIAKVLKRDRSIVYHYEKNHDNNYKTCLVYRKTYDKVNKAYKYLDDSKKLFTDKNIMKSFLLNNGVVESSEPDILIEVKSGDINCIIKTTYLDFSNQLKNTKLALTDYHYTIKLI